MVRTITNSVDSHYEIQSILIQQDHFKTFYGYESKIKFKKNWKTSKYSNLKNSNRIKGNK